MITSKILQFAASKNLLIEGITFNSKDVKKNFIFFAIKGAHVDGNLFIEQAISNGAVLIVSTQKNPGIITVPYYQTEDIEADMADTAYEFYNQPSDFMKMIGITGTKGKTSIAYLLESILFQAGHKVGVLGTINYRINGNKICDAPNTTPAALPLFKLLALMKQVPCQDVVMEVSSHSLEQKRVKHIWYDRAIFTNLQRDHLDYHQTFENYFLAKRKLFENLIDTNNPKSEKTAILNIDDPYAQKLYQFLKGKIKIITFSLNRDSDFKAEDIKETLTYTAFQVNGLKAKINLLGKHNVYNALAAWATAKSMGINEQDIIKGLVALQGVPGRMERIDEGQNFYSFVDFAYTNESLERAFATIAPYKKGKTFLVFGCGGQRDRTKRPLMGQTACKNADFVFLTNDNPRNENQEQIFNDILVGMKNFSNFSIVPDRREAIRKALSLAKENDIVIVAGKGHENYQILGNNKIHFSDQEEIRSFLKEQRNV